MIRMLNVNLHSNNIVNISSCFSSKKNPVGVKGSHAKYI
jgi:hypothetical protein